MMETLKSIVCLEATCPICGTEGASMLKKLAETRQMSNIICENEQYTHYLWRGKNYLVRNVPQEFVENFQFSPC